MAQVNKKPLQTAFIYGFLFGIPLGVSQAVLGVVTILAAYTDFVVFVDRLALILLLLTYFYAAYRAARHTGSLAMGTLAGAFTGLFSAALYAWTNLIASLWHVQMILDPWGIPINGRIFFYLLAPNVAFVLTAMAYGAMVGTLGGVLGRRR